MQTADDNSRFTLKAFKTTFVLYSFKLVVYLDTTAMSNQVKYHLTTNRGNFEEMSLFENSVSGLDGQRILWTAVEKFCNLVMLLN